eukprot:TRINITY_DN16121_c0_g1_i1.p1 TRINITY_DN16121_c0_g1~~TRINITY_DN16121_c0_g1_i1.p1  ORF type:complete len:649 (+),score=198.70 TRINITY_DN16121_c0_g1_i1:98-2044(+)
MAGLAALSVGALKKLAAERRVSLFGCVEKSEIVAKLAAAGVTPPEAATAAARAPPGGAQREHREALLALPREELVAMAKKVKVHAMVRDAMTPRDLADLILAAPGGPVAAAMQRAAMKRRAAAAPAPTPTPAPAPAPAPPPTNPAATDDLALLSVKQLRAFAAGLRVDVSHCLEKSEMVAALTQAQGGAAAAPKRKRSKSRSPSASSSSGEVKRRRQATPRASKQDSDATAGPAAVNVPLTSTQAMRGTPPPAECLESDTESEASSHHDGTPDPRRGARALDALEVPPAARAAPEYVHRPPGVQRPWATCQNRTGEACDVRPCRSVERFKQLYLISEGTHGKVWKAYDRAAKKCKALKQFKYDDPNGFPETALKEIEKLQALTHPNVVAMEEVVVGGHVDSIFLVLEYADRDLANLAHMNVAWAPAELARLMLDLVEAVAHLHRHCIIHRDVKEANLLYTKHGVLKLCDFGCARSVGARDVLTPQLVTLWYRAPEVLLGLDYALPADVWSVGVVLGNLLAGDILFRGECELTQLAAVFRTLGVPTAEGYPALHQHFTGATPTPSRLAAALPAAAPPDAVRLLESLLTYDPSRRPAAAAARDHSFFASPAPHRDMPKFPPSDAHLKAKRREARRERNERARAERVLPLH